MHWKTARSIAGIQRTSGSGCEGKQKCIVMVAPGRGDMHRSMPIIRGTGMDSQAGR
jgi:hypothetical protein